MSTAQKQALANENLARATGSLKKGLCLDINWPDGTCKVNIPGALIDTIPMSGVPPIKGAPCWIVILAGQPVCIGPVTRPPLGTVKTAPSSGLLTITGDDGVDYPVTLHSDFTLAVGNRVQLDWGAGGTVIATPAADPYSGQSFIGGATVGGGGKQTRQFYPTGSGTWRDGSFASGWVSGDLWDSDHNRGAYFYEGIAATIPDNATVLDFAVFMPPAAGYGGNPSIGGHALPWLSGDLSITGRREIPSSGGWISITDLFDAFKVGSLLGIGTGGGGNWTFPGRGGQNGLINAVWST